MALEGDALLPDAAESLQRKHLKPPRSPVSIEILPGREPMEAAHVLDDQLARAKMQVVGVGEDDLGTGAADITRD